MLIPLNVAASLSATHAKVVLAGIPTRPYPPESIEPLAVLMKQSPNFGRPTPEPHAAAPRSVAEHTHQFAGHADDAPFHAARDVTRPTRTELTVHSPEPVVVAVTATPEAFRIIVPDLPSPQSFDGAVMYAKFTASVEVTGVATPVMRLPAMSRDF